MDGQGKTPTESRDVKPGWVLHPEPNASRQLFSAPARPSNVWHPALAARMADGQGSCPERGPCQSLPAAATSTIAAQPFSSMSCLCTSPQHQLLPGQGSSGRGVRANSITVAFTAWLSSPCPSSCWTTQVKSHYLGSVLCTGAHQPQLKQDPGTRAALPAHHCCLRAWSRGRS